MQLLFQVTDRFGKSIQNQLQPLYRHHTSGTNGMLKREREKEQQQTNHSQLKDLRAVFRENSLFPLLFFLEHLPAATIEIFVFELYSPYSDVLQNYGKYEREQLKDALNEIKLVCIDLAI